MSAVRDGVGSLQRYEQAGLFWHHGEGGWGGWGARRPDLGAWCGWDLLAMLSRVLMFAVLTLKVTAVGDDEHYLCGDS